MRKHIRNPLIALLALVFVSLSISSAGAAVVYPDSGGSVDLSYSITGSVSNTDCSNPAKAAGFFGDIYRVSADATIKLYMKAGSLGDPYVQVVQADRTTIVAEDDDSGAGYDSYIHSVSVTTGDYIIATSYGSGATGSYTLYSDTAMTQVLACPQRITLNAQNSFTYGASLSVTASTNMGLPVTLTTSTPTVCSIASSSAPNFSISSLDVGTCTIQASQGGNGSVEAAPNVDRNITINKRSVGLIGLSGNKDYDGTTVATLTGTPSLNSLNIVGSDDVTVTGTPTGTFSSANAGSRTITVSDLALAGSNANRYELNNSLSATINRIAQTITWSPTQALTPSDSGQLLAAATSNGGGSISYAIVNAGTTGCSISGRTLSFNGQGNCTVRASAAQTTNYTATYVDVTLAISKLNQTVSWSPGRTSLSLASDKYLPEQLAATTGTGSISYSVQSRGGTSCNVNSRTAEITYSAIGKCVVRASAAATSNENSAFVDVEFEVFAPSTLKTPTKPLNLTAVISGDQVTLKWQAPKDLVADNSNSYVGTLVAGTETFTCETTKLECTITGIKRNLAYDATAIAKNSSGNSPNSNSVRVFSPAVVEVTQGTRIPPTFEPTARRIGLSPLAASSQDQLVKLGIVDAPSTTTIVAVSNDLTNNKFDVETLTNSARKISAGTAVGIKLTPPADTPAGTLSYAYLKSPDGNWILLGSSPVVAGSPISLPPMSFVFPGTYEILWTLKAPAGYQPLSFLKSSLAGIFNAVSATPELGMHTVQLGVTVEKGSAELPTLVSATPTPTPTPTPTEIVETPVSPEPVTATAQTTDAPAAGEVVAFSPLDNPAGVADTAVTALALAAAAGAAAGAAGSRSGGGGSSGGGSRGDDSGSDEGSLSTIDIELKGHQSEKLGFGDRFKIWTLPIMNFLDKPTHDAGVNSAEYSPLISKFIIDGAYLRAMFGSLTLLGTFAAMVLGFTSAMGLDGDVLPPPALVLGIIAVIGVFDALSGFLGMFTFAITALALADERTAGDIRMLMGVVLLGFGPVLLANGARNFRGESSYSGEYIWERITDVAVGAFLAGWSAMAMVSVLPALAGLTLPIADSAKAIGLAVAIATIVRIAAEEAAARLFPARLNELHPTDVDDSSLIQKMIALGLRAGVFFFVAAAFIGYEWYLVVGTLLFIIPSYLGLFADRVPNNPMLFQVIPAGLPGLIFSLALGTFTVGLISSVLGDDPLLAKLSFVLVPIPVFIVAILSLIGREPREGDVRWYERDNFKMLYRVGGAVAFFTVLKMTGILA